MCSPPRSSMFWNCNGATLHLSLQHGLRSNTIIHRSAELLWLKRWIWLYFWLLIFEGVLRKWLLPQLSMPLLVVRDPVLLVIYWMAFRSGRVHSPHLLALGVVSVPLILLASIQVASGTNSCVIALYGLRSYLLHLPLIVIISETFTFEDVKQVGRWLLILSVPIALLMLAQYRAPVSSWLNAGAGGTPGQMRSAGDHVRAAGPFSFATGTTCFFALAEAFLLYALSRPRTYSKWILVPSVAAVIIALPLSGSRTLLFVTAAVVIWASFAIVRIPGQLPRLAGIIVVFGLGSIAVLWVPAIHESIGTFQNRWQQASAGEGDVKDVLSLRVLGVIMGGVEAAETVPWIGKGIGMGSNVAAYLETGSQSFLLAEMEWPRVVLELGPILGLAFMTFRILVCWTLFVSALRALGRRSSLSWLLVPATVPFLIINSMEQPTNLGFMVLSAGLCLAAAKTLRAPQPSRHRTDLVSRRLLATCAPQPCEERSVLVDCET